MSSLCKRPARGLVESRRGPQSWQSAVLFSGANVAVGRLATAVVASLFREDLQAIRRNLEELDEPEFEGIPVFVR
jgi:hypothetical protein